MNNKKSITTMTVILAIISVVMLTPTPAEAASYYSGEHWDLTDPDHAGELYNGSIPFAVDKTRLSANLDLARGTTINHIYAEINSVISALDATDAKLVRYDTMAGDHDNVITSRSLSMDIMGISKDKIIHFKIDGWKIGFDNHILRSKIVLNDNGNFAVWDHNGYNKSKHEVNTYNILIHEMGHALGLCDTYAKSDTSNRGLCTGVVDITSIMSNEGMYQTVNRALTATDIATLNGAY